MWDNSKSTTGSTKDKVLCDFITCYYKRLATVSYCSNKQFISPT